MPKGGRGLDQDILTADEIEISKAYIATRKYKIKPPTKSKVAEDLGSTKQFRMEGAKPANYEWCFP